MRVSVIAACLSLCLIGFSLAQDAHASIRKETNIPAEGLGPALNALARERNFQIVYVTEEIANVHTDGAVGEFTTDEALKRLLAGTGLIYRYLDDKTVTIGSATAPQSRGTRTNAESSGSPGDSNANKEGKKSTSGDFRVAQLDQNSARSQAIGNQNTEMNKREEGLSEIIVTAQKREERLIDVPISIAVLTADELKQREINDIDDLRYGVPGLSVQENGISRLIEIRGISDALAGSLPLIGAYLDEASVIRNNQLDLNTYDLERVEVLRGPQGTLFGQGSAGGTIRFITKNPNLGNFAFDSDVAALFTQGGAPGQRVNAMVNVPLIDQELGLRIAGTFEGGGGWVDQPAAGQKNINGQELVDVRAKALWQPLPQFTVIGLAEIHRNETSTQMGEDSNGDYTQAFNQTTTPTVVDSFQIYNLALTYDFSRFRVLSTTTYLNQDLETAHFGYPFPASPPPAPPLEIYYPENTNQQLSGGGGFSEEVRLTSTGAGPWQWTLGGNYDSSRFITDVAYAFGAPGPLPPPPYPVIYSHLLSTSWAGFGDTSYKLGPLTLGAGLRYYRNDQDLASGIPPVTQSGKFSSSDPRFYAQYKVAPDTNIYASAAKGFRSGGFNSEKEPAYEPESVWTYELGSKMSVLDGRLSADVAVFYSRYTDYQIFGLPPLPEQPIGFTRNAGDVWIKGLEWDLTWRPADLWTLSFNGNEMDTRFYKINVTASAYDVGDPVDFVPDYEINLGARRDFTWDGKPGFVRLDYAQRGSETYRNRSIGPWYYGQTSVIHMLNLNTGLTWNHNLALGIFVQNLLNDRNYIDPYYIEGYAPRNRPRTFGIEFHATSE